MKWFVAQLKIQVYNIEIQVKIQFVNSIQVTRQKLEIQFQMILNVFTISLSLLSLVKW